MGIPSPRTCGEEELGHASILSLSPKCLSGAGRPQRHAEAIFREVEHLVAASENVTVVQAQVLDRRAPSLDDVLVPPLVE